jgi:hypothetical protein
MVNGSFKYVLKSVEKQGIVLNVQKIVKLYGHITS